MGDVLIFAEQQLGHFPKTTLTALNAGLELAQKRGGKAIAVVAGDNPDALAAEIAKYSVSKVIALTHPALKNYLADAYAHALANLARSAGVEYILATATATGKDLMPRLAARLGAPMASDITAINDDGTVTRPMYAGNALANIEMDGPFKVITVRGTAFDAAKPSGSAAAVEKVNAEIEAGSLKMEFEFLPVPLHRSFHHRMLRRRRLNNHRSRLFASPRSARDLHDQTRTTFGRAKIREEQLRIRLHHRRQIHTGKI